MTSLSLFDDLRYRRADMMGSQPRRRSATDGAPGRGRSIWRRAEPLVVDGLAGHGSVVGLTADVVVLVCVGAGGWVTGIGRQRGRVWAAYPLTLVALLWIAPFYGFFSAPLFLGLSLNTMCPGRSLATIVLVTLGMRVGEKVGLEMARWSNGAPPS